MPDNYPEKLRFVDHKVERQPPAGMDATTKLQDFAITTYALGPERLRGLLPSRFRLDTVTIDGVEQALLSAVSFTNYEFTQAFLPFLKFRFAQVNYRLYVTDKQTGERVVWFLGTVVDSWTVFVTRYLWRLPWYYGKVDLDCCLEGGRYTSYSMRSVCKWASARLDLEGVASKDIEYDGFVDQETALVFLSHRLKGFYRRLDGRIGSVRVWHEPLEVMPGRCVRARFDLLADMGLVSYEEQQKPHSVLMQPENEFTIYLPPTTLPS